jgi:UDP-N-acetylmuramoylalanine--D-glutamate ligase
MNRVARCYLIGDAARDFETQLAGAVECVQCGDLNTAVARAAADASARGGVVLLSPACASYDQFRNFEERGDMFRKLAQSIGLSNGAAA